MKKTFNKFLQRLTFERQLGITVALGILFLALFSTLVGSWLSNERVTCALPSIWGSIRVVSRASTRYSLSNKHTRP